MLWRTTRSCHTSRVLPLISRVSPNSSTERAYTVAMFCHVYDVEELAPADTKQSIDPVDSANNRTIHSWLPQSAHYNRRV